VTGRLKVGVIGLGFFGSRHARVFHDHPAAELIAVADLDGARVDETVDATGAKGLADYRALLALPEIQAVSICLPDLLHEEAAIAAAKAGKAILLEKPLAHTAEAARRIVAVAERCGTRLMIGHILRFDTRYVQVFNAASPENLGQPIHLRAKRNATRSVARRLGASSSILFYMGVHDVDAMQWIGRSKITKVYAQKREALGTGNEDALYAVLNFENGAIGIGVRDHRHPIRGRTRRIRSGAELRHGCRHDRWRHASLAGDQRPDRRRAGRRDRPLRHRHARRHALPAALSRSV
jgi:predicted dehydrogenase